MARGNFGQQGKIRCGFGIGSASKHISPVIPTPCCAASANNGAIWQSHIRRLFFRRRYRLAKNRSVICRWPRWLCPGQRQKIAVHRMDHVKSCTASPALFDCSVPIECRSISGNSARKAGHLSLASATRFSAERTLPASNKGRISATERVFDRQSIAHHRAVLFAILAAAAICALISSIALIIRRLYQRMM